MASVIRLAVAEAIRAETSGADQINLLAFLMCMTDTQLSVLRETDTSEFFVKFVRASKALRAGATAGPVVESTSRAGGIAGAPAAEHPRDQQAPSPTSSAPSPLTLCRSSSCGFSRRYSLALLLLLRAFMASPTCMTVVERPTWMIGMDGMQC
eukprot:XP_001692427.1 predicted protein [Chlamydomonas reinhardtii]